MKIRTFLVAIVLGLAFQGCATKAPRYAYYDVCLEHLPLEPDVLMWGFEITVTYGDIGWLTLPPAWAGEIRSRYDVNAMTIGGHAGVGAARTRLDTGFGTIFTIRLPSSVPLSQLTTDREFIHGHMYISDNEGGEHEELIPWESFTIRVATDTAPDIDQ